MNRRTAKKIFKDHKAPGVVFKPALKTQPVDAAQIDEPFEVETLEGTMQGKKGDYLMRGVVEGELYICDQEIFNKTFKWKTSARRIAMARRIAQLSYGLEKSPYSLEFAEGRFRLVSPDAVLSDWNYTSDLMGHTEARYLGLESDFMLDFVESDMHLRTAGVFQAPPKMVENITYLAMGAVAALELEGVEAQLDRESRAYKEAKQQTKSFGSIVRKTDQTLVEAPGLRKEYAAYLEAVEHPAARAVAGYGGGRLVPIKQGEFSSLRSSGKLSEWWAREKASIEEHQRWRINGMKESLDKNREKQAQIQKYLRSNVSPKIDQTIEVPVDLSDWRYGDIAHKLEKSRDRQVQEFQQALQKAQEMGLGSDILAGVVDAAKKMWKSIRVNLVVEMRLQNAVGTWNPATKTLTVKLPRRLDQIDEVRNTIRHELQHMAQSLMTNAIRGFDYYGPEVAGMPSKRVQTPQYSQTLDEGFINADPQRYPKAERDKAIRRLQSLGVDKHYLRSFSFHTVDDVEFATRLADDIETFQSMVRNGAVKDIKAAIRVFTFASTSKDDRDAAGVLVDPSKFFRNLKLAARGKWKEAIKQFIKVVL